MRTMCTAACREKSQVRIIVTLLWRTRDSKVCFGPKQRSAQAKHMLNCFVILKNTYTNIDSLESCLKKAISLRPINKAQPTDKLFIWESFANFSKLSKEVVVKAAFGVTTFSHVTVRAKTEQARHTTTRDFLQVWRKGSGFISSFQCKAQ